MRTRISFFYRFFAALAASLPEPPSEEALFDTLGEHLAFEFPPKDPEELPKRWVKELDRHGLARSVLIASGPWRRGVRFRRRARLPRALHPLLHAEPPGPGCSRSDEAVLFRTIIVDDGERKFDRLLCTQP